MTRAITTFTLPLFIHSVPAGFPSPADDYLEQSLDLNTYLIKHPAATYLARAKGDSMEGCGIFDGDLLVVDRSRNAQHGEIIIAALDGQLTCKILDKNKQCLISANKTYAPIAISEFSDLIIEGVVIHSIRHHV
ncbi:MAG: translesion error-prone DNA polymerase V autoproteolytic subunit [gamma proteobacterium symbiont of Bathyaustriella thionipta]|nr:translesion error-prone DNA polymerase V autoproteolytic subunit [gamma proteobacterium symbiont of Bathyaustriella thionipta]MCU7949833.1 translesion error-prone DNA polymerase V autoproteolytic subunit [gamma proteobacterium symbiont of Bathyaustriella thionipta]MCU7954095.1 translesion error-prone DNA polymerase V autoproteolytic subunit [gamma proteobacterium symbiont of Bathyaustriella thionipta]MCU7956407.1 translesion error-prone DNA polymerase V autoproteolytic subunit [gamma proteoba